MMRLIPRQKRSFIISSFNKCMCCISICFYCCQNYSTMLITQFIRLSYTNSTILNGMLIDSSCILYSQRNIFNPITMFNKMCIHLRRRIFSICRTEYKSSIIMISNNMRYYISLLSL